MTRRFRLRLPSPAVVVALGALLLSVAGSAGAVTAMSSANTTVVRETTGTGKLAVYCKKGEKVTGGGVASLTNEPILSSVPLRGSVPAANGQASNGWGGSVRNNKRITVYVVCER